MGPDVVCFLKVSLRGKLDPSYPCIEVLAVAERVSGCPYAPIPPPFAPSPFTKFNDLRSQSCGLRTVASGDNVAQKKKYELRAWWGHWWKPWKLFWSVLPQMQGIEPHIKPAQTKRRFSGSPNWEVQENLLQGQLDAEAVR